MNNSILIILLASIFLNACMPTLNLPESDPTEVEVPTHPLYVITTQTDQWLDQKNHLHLFAADTLTEHNNASLMENSLFFKFSRDPQGRIWIGYAGTLEHYTKRVDVFRPNGSLLKTMDVCSFPNMKISFVGGNAYIPCYLNGFHAELAIVDLESLEIVTKIELTADPRFSLLASAANEEIVLVIGSNGFNGTMFFIDPKSLSIRNTITFDQGGEISTILEDKGRFYFLNQSSSLDVNKYFDLIVVTPGNSPIINTYHLAERSPYLGFIADNTLYAYHRLIGPGLGDKRAISRTDLKTFESKSWSLPDAWNAGSIFMLHGKVTLTGRNATNQGETSGLHTFDFETGKLTKILDLPGALLAMTED